MVKSNFNGVLIAIVIAVVAVVAVVAATSGQKSDISGAATQTGNCEWSWPQKVVLNGAKYSCGSGRNWCNYEKAKQGIGECCKQHSPYRDCVSVGPAAVAGCNSFSTYNIREISDDLYVDTNAASNPTTASAKALEFKSSTEKFIVYPSATKLSTYCYDFNSGRMVLNKQYNVQKTISMDYELTSKREDLYQNVADTTPTISSANVIRIRPKDGSSSIESVDFYLYKSASDNNYYMYRFDSDSGKVVYGWKIE